MHCALSYSGFFMKLSIGTNDREEKEKGKVRQAYRVRGTAQWSMQETTFINEFYLYIS